MTAKIKAIIFDWNGVITDSFGLDYSIFVEEVKKIGLKITKSKKFYKDLYNSNIFDNLIKIGLKKSDLKRDKEYKVYYSKNIIKSPIFPGIKSLLRNLRGKYRLALITANYNANINAFDKRYKIKHFFDAILTSDKSHYKEDNIKAFMEKFLLKKNEIIFVGDTVNDIKAARKFGIRIIAVTWGYHGRGRLTKAKPSFIATKPTDIEKILERVDGKDGQK